MTCRDYSYSYCWFRLPRALVLAASIVLVHDAISMAQSPATARPQPGSVDLSLSRVFMFVGKTGLGHEHGVMGSIKSGSIMLGQQRRAGSLVFDMKSFDADGPDARKYVGLPGTTDEGTRRQVNSNMHGAAVLNTTKFPTATFQIDSAILQQKRPGETHARYLLKGNFTLVGVSRPLQLECEVIPMRDQQRMRTGFTLAQTDFGITPYSKAFGAVGVANELKVYGEIIVAGSEH